MTAETYVTDAATRHAVFVERFAGGEANKAKEHLERIRLGVIERLSRDPTDFRADRLGRVLNDIDTLISLVMQEMSEEINETVRDFASNEASFAGELIQSTSRTEVALPSDALLIAVINREGMNAPLGPEQITIQEALDQFAGKKSQEVLQTIKDAMVAGDTLSETTDRVSNLVNGRQKTQVEALTRTIMNHTSNHATKAVMQENQAILQGEKWVATLDSRTTLVCAGRDGRIYPVGQGPYPPAHWQCRSRRVPVVADEFAVDGVAGKRGAIGGKMVDGELVETRGQARGDTTYGGWLKRQPVAFQEEFFARYKNDPLAVDKAKLFRQGKIPLDRFRDETGRVYTLEQLKALNPLAFDRADVEV